MFYPKLLAFALGSYLVKELAPSSDQTTSVTILPDLSSTGLVATDQLEAPHTTARYIIIHHRDQFPLITDRIRHSLNATHAITIAELTTAHAGRLAKAASQAQPRFIIEKSEQRQKKEVGSSDQQVIDGYLDTTLKRSLSSSPWLQAQTYCANFKPTNVRFVLLDTLVYPNEVAKGMAFYYGPNYVESTPCYDHGTVVLNELSDMTAPKYLNVTNVAIFNCGGLQDDANATLAWLWIANFTKANKNAGLTTIVNYDWGAVDSAAEQAAIQAAIDAGTVAVLAAGNSNLNICDFDAGYNGGSGFKGAMRIGGTNTDFVKGKSGAREPGDEIASFSDIGQCVKPFAPGYITWNGVNYQGTSGSAPFEWTKAGGIAGGNPNATPQQIVNLATNSCVPIMTAPSNYGYPTCLLTKADFCTIPKIPDNVVPTKLFGKLKTTSTTSYAWYPTNQKVFCVNFTATTSSGASLTAYKNSLGTVEIKAVIGAKISGSSKYRQSLSINGVQVNSTTTASRIIGSKTPILFEMSQCSGDRFCVAYQNAKGKWVDLLSAENDVDMVEAGFAGKDVTYRNALTC